MNNKELWNIILSETDNEINENIQILSTSVVTVGSYPCANNLSFPSVLFSVPQPSITPTRTPTLSPTRSVTPSHTVSRSRPLSLKCCIVSMTPTNTPTNTPFLSNTPTPSMTPTPSITLSITPTSTPTHSITPSITITSSITPSRTPTTSITLTPSLTPTTTPTPTPRVYNSSITSLPGNMETSGFGIFYFTSNNSGDILSFNVALLTGENSLTTSLSIGVDLDISSWEFDPVYLGVPFSYYRYSNNTTYYGTIDEGEIDL